MARRQSEFPKGRGREVSVMGGGGRRTKRAATQRLPSGSSAPRGLLGLNSRPSGLSRPAKPAPGVRPAPAQGRRAGITAGPHDSAYVGPGLKHDLGSVKGLNQSGYRVIHDEDEEESGVFAVINKKINKSRSFPFMSEHSNFSSSQIGTNECNPIREALGI
jgi:hypothetical protein